MNYMFLILIFKSNWCYENFDQVNELLGITELANLQSRSLKKSKTLQIGKRQEAKKPSLAFCLF